MDTFTILGVPGSLRALSLNRGLLVAARDVAPDAVTLEIFDGLGEIPPYNEDTELNPPPTVERFRKAVRDADAILIASPEYNGSIPGQLKNALDWASRPRAASCLDGKPAAVIGASPGRRGATRAQADLRKVLEASKARVLDAEFPVGQAGEKFNSHAELTDEAVRQDLAAYLYGQQTCAACGPWPTSLIELAEPITPVAA